MPLPKPLGKNEVVMVSADIEISQAVLELAKEIAVQEGIPLTGLTILGGKPYINVTGLDAKLKRLEEEKGLIKAEQILEEIERPSQENGWRAGYKCTLILFDKRGFQEALSKIKNASVEVIRELREIFTYKFQDVGFASPDSLKMSSLKNIDMIQMMASRRASNRAKRAAVGCGLTSVDEMGVEPEMVLQGQDYPCDASELKKKVWELAKKLSYNKESLEAFVLQRYGVKLTELNYTQLKELEREFQAALGQEG